MSGDVAIAITRLTHAADLPLPAYETAGAAGMDLRAALAQGEEIVIGPGEREAVPTGLAIALPTTHEAQVRPRSGLALKSGITCLNSPGTIDSDYRGEIKVVLVNHGKDPFRIRRGDRIAQLIVAPVSHVRWTPVDTLKASTRGSGGFGSSGIG